MMNSANPFGAMPRSNKGSAMAPTGKGKTSLVSFPDHAVAKGPREAGAAKDLTTRRRDEKEDFGEVFASIVASTHQSSAPRPETAKSEKDFDGTTIIAEVDHDSTLTTEESEASNGDSDSTEKTESEKGASGLAADQTPASTTPTVGIHHQYSTGEQITVNQAQAETAAGSAPNLSAHAGAAQAIDIHQNKNTAAEDARSSPVPNNNHSQKNEDWKQTAETESIKPISQDAGTANHPMEEQTDELTAIASRGPKDTVGAQETRANGEQLKMDLSFQQTDKIEKNVQQAPQATHPASDKVTEDKLRTDPLIQEAQGRNSDEAKDPTTQLIQEIVTRTVQVAPGKSTGKQAGTAVVAADPDVVPVPDALDALDSTGTDVARLRNELEQAYHGTQSRVRTVSSNNVPQILPDDSAEDGTYLAEPKAKIQSISKNSNPDNGVNVDVNPKASSEKISNAQTPQDKSAPSPVRQIADNVRDGYVKGRQTMEIQLKPEGLGTVHLRLSGRMDAANALQQLRVEIRVSSPEAQALLERHMGELKDVLRSWDIRLAPAPFGSNHQASPGVTQSRTDHFSQDTAGRHHAPDQQGQNKNDDHSHEYKFDEQMDEELRR